MEQIQLSGKKNLKKIDEIFIPKIYLERADKDLKGQSSNIGKNPYLISKLEAEKKILSGHKFLIPMKYIITAVIIIIPLAAAYVIVKKIIDKKKAQSQENL